MSLAVAACGGGGGGDDDSGSEPTALDNELLSVAQTDLGLTGDPATSRDLTQTRPDDDELVKLGQLLFFSKTLSGGFEVACASCHHPDFAGGDGLSLSVGILSEEPSTIGPGRVLDPTKNDPDPNADGGPNVPRNSQTVFNTALYSRSMFHDGRVFVLDDEAVPQGEGQAIKTPEGGNLADPAAGDTLLQAQSKLPMPSNNEMRGFLYTDLTTPVEYREHLIGRLRGEKDRACCFTDPDADTAAANWLERFRDAYGSGNASDLITMANVKAAIAAYEASMTFVDTPWKRYLADNYGALSEAAKEGAKLFLQSPEEGGLGCAGCHSGDRFTDERFHNVGFPQIGRGKRIEGTDPGRWLVSGKDADLHAFRTPSLINVAETPPYGHAGTFATLEDAIEYHADPAGQVDLFDFTLGHLEQFSSNGTSLYPDAETYTRAAIAAASFAGDRLPGNLTSTQVDRLVAFLESLTDKCVADPACADDWTPAADEDPDGHLLVRGQVSDIPDVDSGGDVEDPDDFPDLIPLDFSISEGLPQRTTFADVEGCTDNLDAGGNTGQPSFTLESTDPDFGLNDPHGFSGETWFDVDSSQVEAVMIAGGVSAAYLDDDCYPDLVFASGDDGGGMLLYENQSGTGFQIMSNVLNEDPGTRFTGAAVADLNGDYRRELLFGNLHGSEIPVYSPDGGGGFYKVAGLNTTRHTYGISFAPLDDTGYPYFFTAHWAGGSGTAGTAPGLWKNNGGDSVQSYDRQAGTTSADLDQSFNFTPQFVDFAGDGNLDLVIASDFETSATLEYRLDGSGGFTFENVTDRDVITDENGMGAAVLDRNNDGVLEWFVTSIDDPNEEAEANWGVTGNRLYENVSTGGELFFVDVTDDAGVRDGEWGWGACAADFDNDGFVDLFHVNGFGHIPAGLEDDDSTKKDYDDLTGEEFQDTPPVLFMNNGDGTFREEAGNGDGNWDIDEPSEGRGVVCFDYDRDGDMDIVVFDHSTGLQFFENDIGHGSGHAFLNIRLVGEAPNTDAIGARVYVTADVGVTSPQTMLRLSHANSNFNSQNPPNLHFGLGTASTADVSVTWPDGSVLSCSGVAANQFLVLDQGNGCPP